MRDGVLFADLAVATTDLQLAATEVPEDLAGSIDGVGLVIAVSTGSLRATRRYVPSALGIWLDYAAFWSRHANQKFCAPPGGRVPVSELTRVRSLGLEHALVVSTGVLAHNGCVTRTTPTITAG